MSKMSTRRQYYYLPEVYRNPNHPNQYYMYSSHTLNHRWILDSCRVLLFLYLFREITPSATPYAHIKLHDIDHVAGNYLSYCEYLCAKEQLCNLTYNQNLNNKNDDQKSFPRDIVYIPELNVVKRQIGKPNSKPVSVITSTPVTPLVKPDQHLDPQLKAVSIDPKDPTIQLPNDQIVLFSYAYPESVSYKYNWELISPLNNEENIGNIEGVNEKQVKLSHLKAGNYTFRVTVTTADGVQSLSEQVLLTVLPPAASNKPPVVIIEPKNSTVQLPNANTVLDGSNSYDDDRIIKYEWQAIKVPIGYKNSLANSSILRLKDLVPGLYVFNLTVTDSHNSTNSTTASITVLKEIDYPPTANAGPDQVVYLPQTEITLNGNQSTDDKGIASWHWTLKLVDHGSMAIEMSGTSTPYLHLSKLEIGVYMFVLQVTDTANQQSTDEIYVFVKPENNEAPKANAGDDLELVLPIDSVVYLDGSKSTDDIEITKWQWTQLSGPKSLPITADNTSRASISSFVPGVYNFSLTVWDLRNLSSTAYKLVTVRQDQNQPPKANAGGDKMVTLPASEVTLDGSRSTDDAEIVSYQWERMPTSLAYGQVLANSSLTPVLRLINLVAGRYLFKLTVTDRHGATDFDVASLIVKQPIDILDEIECILNCDVLTFTEEQKSNFYKRLELLLSDDEQTDATKVKIMPRRIEKNHERRVILVFAVAHTSQDFKPNNQDTTNLSIDVVRHIKAKLKMDANYFAVQVLSVDTVVCQNSCSSHGNCDHYTKRCMCEAFWMENFIRFYFGDNESNCEWSILYVVIISFTLLLTITAIMWSCILFIAKFHHRQWLLSSIGRKQQRKYKRTNRFRYMLIDQSDQLEMMTTTTSAEAKHVATSSTLDSDDESESLFDLSNAKNRTNMLTRTKLSETQRMHNRYSSNNVNNNNYNNNKVTLIT